MQQARPRSPVQNGQGDLDHQAEPSMWTRRFLTPNHTSGLLSAFVTEDPSILSSILSYYSIDLVENIVTHLYNKPLYLVLPHPVTTSLSLDPSDKASYLEDLDCTQTCSIMANNGSKPADFGYQNLSPTSQPGYVSASNPLSPVRDGSSHNRFASGPSPHELSHARIPTVPEEEPISASYFPSQSQSLGYNQPATFQPQGPALRAPERGHSSGPQSPESSEMFSPYAQSHTYSQATIYDPAERYGLADEENVPNRYGRRPLLHAPGVGSFEQSTEALNKGASSFQSAQSKRSKYDSKIYQMPFWDPLTV